MRFADSQVLVSSFVRDNFSDSEVYPFSFPTTSYFLRGRHLFPSRSLKHLREHIPRATPRKQRAYLYEEGDVPVNEDSELLLESKLEEAVCDMHVTKELVREHLQRLSDGGDLTFKSIPIDYWREIRSRGTFENQRLIDINLWDLVLRRCDPQLFEYIRDGVGYQSLIGPWNAAEHLPALLGELGGGTQSSIIGGMGRLPVKLREMFTGAGADTKIHTRWILKRIKSLYDGKLQLDFLTPGESVSVVATNVVLALPVGAARRVAFEIKDKHLTEPLRQRVGGLNSFLEDAIVSIPALKVVAFFEKPWWWTGLHHSRRQKLLDYDPKLVQVAPDGEFGGMKIVTDTPVRQLYFHGRGGYNFRRSGGGGRVGALVVAYCDASEVDYWRSLSNTDGGFFGEDTDWFDEVLDSASRAEYTQRAVGLPFKRAFMKFLNSVFKGFVQERSFTEPLGIVLENWSEPPTYGGWHGWRSGSEPWELRERFSRPFKDLPLFMCGEAISCEQGWIEGAWRSVERMLQRPPFELPKPRGIDANLKAWRNNRGRSSSRNFEAYVNW